MMKYLRDYFKIVKAYLLFWLYIPHIVAYIFYRKTINEDLLKFREGDYVQKSLFTTFMFHLHNNSYFRTLFYHRCGPILTAFIGWYRPGDKYFLISKTTKIGKGCFFEHPYATILNANTIGENFFCIQCTTLGNKNNLRPTIGNNVTLGANVVIIGDVNIGNNVTIGAGSVVVKDIPDNCIAAGNPCKVIKSKNPNYEQS